ncbi:MAG: alpha/beta hydrolase-fold protein, partial [Tepidisphaeraceae bacterium]
MIRAIRVLVLLSILVSSGRAAPLRFSVSFDAATRAEPATGRLVVYLLRADAPVSPMQVPAHGFVEADPQPLFGAYVTGLVPATPFILDDSATSFPAKMSELPPGKYKAQAVLDVNRQNSSWQRGPGNLVSDSVAIEVTPDMNAPVTLKLNHAIAAPVFPKAPGVELFEVKSKLLSDFRGKDVYLRAGVCLPADYDPNRAYPAVYEVPGFGGDHFGALFRAQQRQRRQSGSPAAQVARDTFWIELDPESPNGHTLFADSENNGPWARALMEELIPALEAKYPLIPQASARLLRGHSSGGWSTLWLATQYPDFFGATWSTAPDPVDFRRFELCDIYSQPSMYTGSDGKELPSARFHGRVTMTVRQENGMEYVLGTRLDSGQQWASWQAAFGHRAGDGYIVPLFDPVSGAIDRAEAESYHRFDIAANLRGDPKRYVPVFRSNVRIVVGGQDSYYLEEAVKLLQADLDKLSSTPRGPDEPGYIKIV